MFRKLASGVRVSFLGLSLIIISSVFVFAQDETGKTMETKRAVDEKVTQKEEKSTAERLDTVVVKAKPEGGPFLPDLSGAKIYAGKKTTSFSLNQAPSVQPDQYRRVFSQAPGLLVSEMQIPSQVNLSYRGLNDPHESKGLLVMKDGIPLLSDWHGYPTLYYSPPLEAVERVEFIRGGSSLLYGPQPGPVLNYVTYLPPADKKFTADTKHSFGNFGMYSLFNSLGGTVGPLGYYGYYGFRQADGPRENSDYSVHSGNAKGTLQMGESSRLGANFDTYSSESGEAGRLTFAQYSMDPNLTTRFNDRIWIDREVGSVTYEQEITENGLLTIKPWMGHQERLSRRQTGVATNLDRQEFTFVGVDNRLRWLWEFLGNQQALTGGFVFYYADAPRNRRRGLTPESDDGPEIFKMDRSTQYWALFAEHLFKYGRFSVVPAFRLEMISLAAQEKFNTGVTRSLINEDFFSAVPLFGLGLAFDLGRRNELYANISQGYRPKEYDDLANPTSSTQLFSSNLEESQIWNYEAGVRGKPAAWFMYDTSFFFIDYDNYIENLNLGGGNVKRSNSGRALFGGWEATGEMDVIGLYDDLAKSEIGKTIGKLGPYANIQLLDAEFVGGANDGKDPSYSPEYVVKGGLSYNLPKWFKATLSSVFVADHHWQDSNSAISGATNIGTTKVGTYKVWDLALEVFLYKDILSVFGGASNLFNETYYSRVRSDGIEPAEGRNVYGGLKVKIGFN